MTDRSEVRKIKENGIEIAYREYGLREPILMIAGYSATLDMWSPKLISELLKDYRVIVFDNRGAGYSTDDGKEFSIPLFAEDTKAFLDSLGIEKTHILAWSMGTNVALEMAAKYPDKIITMTLYAADCGGKEAYLPDPEVYKTLADTSGSEQERGMRLLGLLFPAGWFEKNPDVMSYFPDVKESVTPDVIKKQYGAMENWEGSYSYLPEIKIPVLLITGTEDNLTPPENSLLLAEKIYGSWLVQLRESGHGAMYQYPEKMASLVRYFICSEDEK